MPRSIAVALFLAASSLAVHAQSADGVAASSDSTQTQPAPIVRATPGGNGAANPGYEPGMQGPGMQDRRVVSQVKSSQPMAGVLVRSGADSSVQTVSADAKGVQLRLDHGRVNVSVHRPAANSEIVVDLPGGQVSLLKDGLYTFNADTNTVRVLKGEAAAYPGATNANSGGKGIKVKEYHEVAFGAGSHGVRSVEVDPREARADLLPGGYGDSGGGYGEPRGYGYRGYGYGPYGDGYYGYPYAYPYYGYPYGYGFGLGFGYFGGFRGGYGFRGFRR